MGERAGLAAPFAAARIPGCHATFLPGEGHLLIIDRLPDLAAALRRAAPPV